MSTSYTPADGRKFGLTLGGFLLVLATIARWRGHAVSAPVLAIIAVMLLGVAVVAPAQLRLVDKAWMGLAHIISRVTTPLFMGLIYFLVLTPIGVGRRLFGSNPLVHKAADAGFWADRSQSMSSSLERQF